MKEKSVSGQLVSAYAASRLLERDRQTIERAVRGLTPDTFQNGKPRWRLARIVDALNARGGRNYRPSDAVNHDLERRFAELEQRYDAVRTAPTLEERRRLARAFFAFLAETEDAMYADARRSGEDPRLTSLRVAEHTRLHVATLRHALGWNFDEAWAEFMKADHRVYDER
jgi:hypothetical protein